MVTFNQKIQLDTILGNRIRNRVQNSKNMFDVVKEKRIDEMFTLSWLYVRNLLTDFVEILRGKIYFFDSVK